MTLATRLALASAVLLMPAAAQAHSPFPGLKGLYVGFVHPLTQPAQVMLLLTLGFDPSGFLRRGAGAVERA